MRAKLAKIWQARPPAGANLHPLLALAFRLLPLACHLCRFLLAKHLYSVPLTAYSVYLT